MKKLKKKKKMKMRAWKMKKTKIQWAEIRILKKMKWILRKQAKALNREQTTLLNKA